jgi:hypothetical protein
MTESRCILFREPLCFVWNYYLEGFLLVKKSIFLFF